MEIQHSEYSQRNIRKELHTMEEAIDEDMESGGAATSLTLSPWRRGYAGARDVKLHLVSVVTIDTARLSTLVSWSLTPFDP